MAGTASTPGMAGTASMAVGTSYRPAALVLEVPGGWEQVPVPETVIAVRRVPDGRGFAPNVVVISTPDLPARERPARALQQVRETAARRRDGEVSDSFAARLAGVEFVGCDVAFNDDSAGTLVQVHLFGALPRAGGRIDLVQLTGTVAGDRVEQDYPLVKSVIATLRVRE